MSNRERQTMEFEVIESIFGGDVEDLRIKTDNIVSKSLFLSCRSRR